MLSARLVARACTKDTPSLPKVSCGRSAEAANILRASSDLGKDILGRATCIKGHLYQETPALGDACIKGHLSYVAPVLRDACIERPMYRGTPL